MKLKHWVYRGIARARSAGPRAGNGLRALLYHSVGADIGADPYGNSIDRGLFESHIRRIAAGPWRCVAFGPPSAGRELAITFDDGYRDTLEIAAPLFQALGLPMTVFVTAAFIQDPGKLYLDRARLKELAALPGVVIGSHGHTHAKLDLLEPAALSRELSDSRSFLEDLLGKPVKFLSYPHGRVDRRVRDAAAAAGYEAAGCSLYGLNEPGRDPLMLYRTEITRWDSLRDLELKIEGHWDWFRWRQALA
ncbi:MAG: polysaccharide deacetylase family protein [Elusimicrobia bacterium]|nr:polysaccharide deacetylase family protein [Elusimicrobiota bacterium]